MQMTEDLFERFFRKECTPEEEQQVREYFQQRLPGLEKDLTEEDWAAFHHKGILSSSVSDKMLSVIDEAILPPKTKRLYFRWVAAAALIPIGLAVWKWTTYSGHSGASIAASQPAVLHHWKEKMNQTGKTILLSLPDSSSVELADKSSIRYEDAFTRSDRAIYLKGKALFTVASSPARPFTVYAGGLSTTALGTVFSVSCIGDSTTGTEVSLLSGKVVVRPDSLLQSRGVKETFLQPGQQLKFDPSKLSVLVHSLKTEPSHIQSERPPAEKIMRFNNTPLRDIFQTLEKEYHCRFSYKRAEIDDIRFTGSFNSNKETLSDFLNTIALLNNLTLTEKNNTFYLK
jgi:ferric-dicitrate binding protein FerR (iron transport regulator)